MNSLYVTIVGIIAATLRCATPLIFGALGGTFSEKSGVVNIALEGIMVAGACFAVIGTHVTGNPWIGIIFAAAAGAFFALIHAYLSINLMAEQVISGTGINVFAPAIMSFIMFKMFGNPSQSPGVTSLPYPRELFSKIPIIGGIIGDLNWFVWIAIILVFVSTFIFNKTSFGLRIKAVGEHPKAADTLGINVYKMRYISVILSGILAGIGGASLSIGVLNLFREGMVSGRGFIALAAMIFGNWKPKNAMWACLLFGFAESLQLSAQSFAFKLPEQFYSAFPYILTMLVLAGFVGKTQAPAEDGVPYKKGER